ncbi:MAG: VanZ family protein [Bacteroidales bacterium]
MKIIRVVFKILFIIYLALVFFFCLYSFKDTGVDLSSTIFGIRADRVAHFIMFFPYPLSAWLAVKKELREKMGRFSHPVILGSGILVAILAELLQSTTPTRDSDPFDLIANIAGLILASILIFTLEKYIDYVWPDRL